MQERNWREHWIPFLVAFSPFYLAPSWFPQLHLTWFAPFLVANLYRFPLASCLWWAMGCGLLYDLLSGYRHLGLYACSYVATTMLLYRQRKHFFADSWSTLPILCFFFSALSTALLAGMLSVFESPLGLSTSWVITDLILYPMADSLYALIFFVVPMLLWKIRPTPQKRFQRARPK